MTNSHQLHHIRILTHDGRDITDPVWPMYDLMHLYNARQAAAINLRNEGESKGTVEYIDDIWETNQADACMGERVF